MKKSELKKTHILIVAYIILIVTELFLYVPYHSIQIFRSDQNVPHTEIIGNGYVPLAEIRKDKAWLANNDKTTTGKRVDSGQLVTNLFMTTISAIFIYFIFIYLEDKAKVLEVEVDALKKENEMLNRNVGYLYKDNRILCEYKTSILRLKKALAEIADGSNMQYIEEIPTLDINALAFEDEDTIANAQAEYARKMAEYIKRKVDL